MAIQTTAGRHSEYESVHNNNKPAVVECAVRPVVVHPYRYAAIAAREPEDSGQDNLPLFVIILLSIAITPVFLQQAAATPYSSGYSRGCNDAKMYNPSDRYINQPGKGPSSHTSSFMQGYYNGYSDCSATSVQYSAQY